MYSLLDLKRKNKERNQSKKKMKQKLETLPLYSHKVSDHTLEKLNKEMLKHKLYFLKHPNSLMAISNYANGLCTLGHFKEAIETFSRALKLKPKNYCLLLCRKCFLIFPIFTFTFKI
jgi:tetratricopeptide (TPR) repeat protein